jgi:midasin (ATPase involved in ribosome maturation)
LKLTCLFSCLNIAGVNASLVELLRAGASFNDDESATSVSTARARSISLALLRQLHPLLAQYRSLVQWYILRLLSFHSSTCDVHDLLADMFTILYTRGFCNPPKDDGESKEGDGEGEFSLLDDVAGTGMADGVGNKDVSDQIESEEQLVGTKGEKKDENKPDEKQRRRGRGARVRDGAGFRRRDGEGGQEGRRGRRG